MKKSLFINLLLFAVVGNSVFLTACKFNSANRYGYVVDTGATGKEAGLSIIDRKTQTVLKTLFFRAHPNASSAHFANVTADGKEIWLGGAHSHGETDAIGNINVFDTAALLAADNLTTENESEIIIKTFTDGSGVQNTISPNGKWIFTAKNQDTKGINIYDVKNKTFVGHIENRQTAPHVGEVSADNKIYYTTTAGSHTVVAYDISGLPDTVPTTPIWELDLGYGNLHALRLHPNGKYLFVGNGTWQIPAGATSTSGVNVIDITTNPPEIIKTIPGRPHNFDVSPDGKYVASTELKANVAATDCDAGSGDLGNRLQFIDVSTLLTSSPEPSAIKDIYHFDTPGLGGSHPGWDPLTGVLYYSVYDNVDSQGWLFVLNTKGLSSDPATVEQIGDKIKIGWGPHGVLFPGRIGS